MALSVRELQYLHREASVGCRRTMVVSRTNGIHTSTTSTLREISQRRGELPALHTSTAAPLRMAIYNSTAAPTTTTHRRPSTRYSRTLTDTTTASSTAPRAAPRRVRFELPPKPPPLEPSSGAPSGKSAHQQVAGVENWLRSRGSGAVRYQYRGVAVHDTRQYSRGTLPPTASQHESSPSSALLQAARDGDEAALADILGGPDDEDEKHFTEEELNCQDSQGRTPVSYIASHGSVPMMELILQHPGVDINKPDNEGNTPLHFAAQAGHVEVINLMLSRCTNIEVDARNALGFTPLMKAALQGRTKCAKVLLFAGASPTLRDTGRGLRAEQWARFCGRHVCAEVIEKFARHRLLERTTAYGRWGSEPELGAQGGVAASSSTQGGGFRSRLRRAFRTNSSGSDSPRSSRYSLVSQLTTAALCASSPVLPTPNVPPVVRSLMRPLVVPKLQVTPAAATESSCEVGEYSGKPSSGAKTKKKK